MSLRSFPSLALLSSAAAEEIARLAAESIVSRGSFTLALSGGSTPKTLYELIAQEYRDKIDWQHVHFFWGDERFISHDDLASNYRMAKETLIDVIPIPSNNIHPVPILAAPSDSSDIYAKELQSFFKGPIPTFDLILLGLGGDGHTASIFPATPIKRTSEGVAIVTESPAAPHVRISLTMNVLNNARAVFFLVSGQEKKEILKAVRAEEGNPDSKYPAARVHPNGKLVWFADEAAVENKK